jgi:ariadne-1
MSTQVNISSVPNAIGSTANLYKNTKECRFCLYTFANDYPHYTCKSCGLNICQSCFIHWLSGKIQADNIGFRVLSCSCGNKIDYNTIKSIFPTEDFIKYDNALTRFALEKEKDIIYCPGKDCPNIFIKPKQKKTKRQCRKATCEHCDTSFCCLCGELYTEDHSKMKCGPYKKWKQENDDETIALAKYLKGERDRGYIKPCPNCHRNVEKKGGCSDMKCTNCDTRFCWTCLTIKNTQSCIKCYENTQVAAVPPRIPLQTQPLSLHIPLQTQRVTISKATKRSAPEPESSQPERRNATRVCKTKRI